MFTQYIEGQVNVEYQKPHKDILELIDAPLPPTVSVNSKGSFAILQYRKAQKTIAELSEPEMRLAGLRINPRTNIYSRQRYFFKLRILDVGEKKDYEIKNLPTDSKFSYIRWSYDEKHIALTETSNDGVALWIVDVDQKTATKVTKANLNANIGIPYTWFPDDQSLLVKELPSSSRELIDASKSIPAGPTVSVNDGKKAQNRTYQDLLKNPSDEKNFEALVVSNLKVVRRDGTNSPWMSNAMIRSMSFSPDGRFVLINRIEKPFSYLVPYYRFPTVTELYASNGDFVKTIQDLPLIEDLPKGFMAVHPFKRNIGWRGDMPASLYWVEALDGGDPDNEVENRDAVYYQSYPFEEEKKKIATVHNRFSYIEWSDQEFAIVHDRWWPNRNTKSYLINLKDQDESTKILFDRNYQDRYMDPGDFVTTKNIYNRRVIDSDGQYAYLSGPGYSDEGVHPFLDRLNLENGQMDRLYQSSLKNQYERIREVVSAQDGQLLISIESKSEYPNYYLRNIHQDKTEQITFFKNPFESISNVHKELITYKREDGVDLSGTLYLPAGYDLDGGEKLPMLLWAYPREYKDKTTAGQISSSEYQFIYPSYGSPIFWVARGYAVLDRAAFPVIGEGDQQPNDSFVKQLVMNGKAAIDAVDEMGYIDRDRVGVGGHSYGAFMTANLLSHSNLFAAGIARSGAYNRTLTPFGFQAEERSYWEAPEIYYAMSPFMHADKMKTPLLLIHGEADNNSGTYPMQSIRYFNALKGLGATVRLVMFPKESHGYAAKESVLHMLWEQDQWLDKFVKHKGIQEIKP